jgi:hypothetical protein
LIIRRAGRLARTCCYFDRSCYAGEENCALSAIEVLRDYLIEDLARTAVR